MDALKSYTHIKLALAGQLRLLREVLKNSGSQHRERQCEDLMVKLAEARFTLAVLGQFTRGKTSLMNAVIGRNLLPTGALPPEHLTLARDASRAMALRCRRSLPAALAADRGESRRDSRARREHPGPRMSASGRRRRPAALDGGRPRLRARPLAGTAPGSPHPVVARTAARTSPATVAEGVHALGTHPTA